MAFIFWTIRENIRRKYIALDIHENEDARLLLLFAFLDMAAIIILLVAIGTSRG